MDKKRRWGTLALGLAMLTAPGGRGRPVGVGCPSRRRQAGVRHQVPGGLLLRARGRSEGLGRGAPRGRGALRAGAVRHGRRRSDRGDRGPRRTGRSGHRGDAHEPGSHPGPGQGGRSRCAHRADGQRPARLDGQVVGRGDGQPPGWSARGRVARWAASARRQAGDPRGRAGSPGSRREGGRDARGPGRSRERGADREAPADGMRPGSGSDRHGGHPHG